jgi:hypothetical protein
MKKFLLLLVLVVAKLFAANAQVVDSMLKVYAEQYPQQKAYVQFDKDIYRAGETIWFKAYMLSGFRLINNSKNFYAELVDKGGNVIQKKVYPIVESSAAGSFDIPENSPATSIVFRGYTTWMLNFDTAFIYDKQITILDKNGASSTAKSTTAAIPGTTSIQFFPEGGSMVNDLESVVAFKANNNFGIPVFAKGNIVNNKGAVVTSFTSQHDGMGTFKLTPVAGENYNAVWTDSTGNQQTTPLPAVKNQGIVMHVSSVGKKKVFVLSRTNEVPAALKSVYVIAQLDQERIYKAKVSLENVGFTSGAIPTENLPTGILTLTVFSSNWEPVAERIIMVNNNNYMFDARVNSLETNGNIRAKNTVEVEVPDTLLCNLSIAITDAALGRQTGDNIISKLLLTGDIKGYVHNPTYYFSNTSDSVLNNLDLVMLTHGWRNYNWSDLAAGKRPRLKFPEDNFLKLTAKIFGVSPASPLRSDEQIMAFITGKDSSKQFIIIPKTGPTEFSTNNAVFYDTIQVFYQFMKDQKLKDKASVLFDNNFYKSPRAISLAGRPWYLQNTDTTILRRTRFLADQINKFGSKFEGKGNVLQSVTVKSKVRSKVELLDDKYASGLFKGDDGYAFDFTGDNANYALDILSYLQGRVPGLQISRNGGDASVSWRGSETSLFIDEIHADADQLLNLSPSDIAYVKVLRPPFMGAIGGGAGGAIAVYTRKGGDVQMTPGKGLAMSRVGGYSVTKQFYSPDYSTRSASSDVVADYRSTLYWDPAIFTGPGRQKVKIEFYNNDVSKSFRVILEGINEIGQLVRIEKVVQ